MASATSSSILSSSSGDFAELSSLDLLGRRLNRLEKQVYGTGSCAVDTNVKVSDSLLSVNSRITNAITGREKMKTVLKRLSDVERYLNPSVGEKLTLEDTTKMDVIIAEEKYIHDTVAQLQKVHELKSMLNSEHIKAVPSNTEKLIHLSKLQLQQEEVMDAQSEDVKRLVEAYNSIIHTLTEQFIQWDELVTKQELAAQPTKQW